MTRVGLIRGGGQASTSVEESVHGPHPAIPENLSGRELANVAPRSVWDSWLMTSRATDPCRRLPVHGQCAGRRVAGSESISNSFLPRIQKTRLNSYRRTVIMGT